MIKTFYDFFFVDFSRTLSEFLGQKLPKLAQITKTKNWWETYVSIHLSNFQKRSLPVSPSLNDLDIAALLKICIENWDNLAHRYFNHNAAFGIKSCLLELKKGRIDISHMTAGAPLTDGLIFRYLDYIERILRLICPENIVMIETCCKLKLHFIPQIQVDLINKLSTNRQSHNSLKQGQDIKRIPGATIIIENRQFIKLENILLPKLKKDIFNRIGLKAWTLWINEKGNPIFNDTVNKTTETKYLSLQVQAEAPDRLMLNYHNGEGYRPLLNLPCRIQTNSKKPFQLFTINIDQYLAFFPVQEKFIWNLNQNEMVIGRTNTNCQNDRQADIRLDFLHHPESLTWEKNREQYGVSLNMLQFSRKHVRIVNKNGEWYISKISTKNNSVFINTGEDIWRPLTSGPENSHRLKPGDKFIVGYYMICFQENYDF